MSKTFYVKLTDEQLNDLALSYKAADPTNDEQSFMLSLALEELKRNRQKQKDGLVVELPVPIGEKGFYLFKTGNIAPAQIAYITCNDKKGKLIKLRSPYTGGVCGAETFETIHKHFFRTPKEAEQAAKEAAGGIRE